MRVIIKKLNENAKLPEKAHESDFGYDVYAVSEKEIAPNVWEYGLGFAYEIDKDTKYYGKPISIDFRPRSSIYKTGMVLSNSVGTLDEMYRGEVKAIFYHVMPNLPRYKVGDKIGQIKLGVTEPLEFVEGEINLDTERGKGGFGSTDKKRRVKVTFAPENNTLGKDITFLVDEPYSILELMKKMKEYQKAKHIDLRDDYRIVKEEYINDL